MHLITDIHIAILCTTIVVYLVSQWSFKSFIEVQAKKGGGKEINGEIYFFMTMKDIEKSVMVGVETVLKNQGAQEAARKKTK